MYKITLLTFKCKKEKYFYAYICEKVLKIFKNSCVKHLIILISESSNAVDKNISVRWLICSAAASFVCFMPYKAHFGLFQSM